MGIEKVVSSDGCELTIQVHGRFDLCQDKAFRAAYQEEDLFAKKVAVDFSATDHLDVTALGMLLLLRKHAGSDSSIISLVGCAPHVEEVLKAARFELLFHIPS